MRSLCDWNTFQSSLSFVPFWQKKECPKKIILVSYTYGCVHISWNRLFWADKQGNHQDFDPSLLTYKCWLIFTGMNPCENHPHENQSIFVGWQGWLPWFPAQDIIRGPIIVGRKKILPDLPACRGSLNTNYTFFMGNIHLRMKFSFVFSWPCTLSSKQRFKVIRSTNAKQNKN